MTPAPVPHHCPCIHFFALGADDPPPPPPRAPRRRYVLQRRLRITTVALGVAATPLQLYTACDAHATTLVLMHKVLGAAAAEGSLQAARALLREWLAALAASTSAVLASEEAGMGSARRRGSQQQAEPAAQEGGEGATGAGGKQVRRAGGGWDGAGFVVQPA